MNYKNKNVAILGWGINGLDAYQFLQKQKASITIIDKKEEKELNFSEIEKDKVRLILGKSYLNEGLIKYDYIFRAPGVYRYLPEIIEAEKNKVIVTSAVKLFFDLCPGKIIGVTGTKGKGTTSTLIYEILEKYRKDIYLAGNIGEPILELIPRLTKNSWVVLELSSFQLIDLKRSPHIAVVLNITEDHMDWHKNRIEYVEAKRNIVKYQNKKDFAVLNYDYPTSRGFSRHTDAGKRYFSVNNKIKGIYVKNGAIVIEEEGNKIEIGKTANLLLRGKHNWENICAASYAAFLAGASIDSINKTIYSFKGLEHRLELVGEINSIKFYNDSFSTNPQTTIAAIKSFTEPITLILGGSDKGLNYDDMGKKITDNKNILNIILIGDIANTIGKSLSKARFTRNIVRLGKMDIKMITKRCLQITPKDGIVLLSPATASFDMFEDYKDRGKQFKEAVKLLVKTS